MFWEIPADFTLVIIGTLTGYLSPSPAPLQAPEFLLFSMARTWFLPHRQRLIYRKILLYEHARHEEGFRWAPPYARDRLDNWAAPTAKPQHLTTNNHNPRANHQQVFMIGRGFDSKWIRGLPFEARLSDSPNSSQCHLVSAGRSSLPPAQTQNRHIPPGSRISLPLVGQ